MVGTEAVLHQVAAGRRGGVPRPRPGAARAPLPGGGAGAGAAGPGGPGGGGRPAGGRLVVQTRLPRPRGGAGGAARRSRPGPSAAERARRDLLRFPPARRWPRCRALRPRRSSTASARRSGVEVARPGRRALAGAGARPRHALRRPGRRDPPAGPAAGGGRPARVEPDTPRCDEWPPEAVRTIDWVDGPAGAWSSSTRPRCPTRCAADAHRRRRAGRRHPPPGGARALPRSARPARWASCWPSTRASARAGTTTASTTALDRAAAARPDRGEPGLGRRPGGRHACRRARDAVLAEAQAVLDEDVAANRAMGQRGADLLGRRCAARRPAGCGSTPTATPAALACVEWGTALGVVRALHERGRARARATPTRPGRCCRAPASPRGSWSRMGVDYRVVVDGAGSVAHRPRARSTPSSSAPTASRPTATWPTRSAPTRSPWPRPGPASRSWWPRPSRPSTSATPDGAAIEIEDRGADEVLAWAASASRPPGAGRSTPRST